MCPMHNEAKQIKTVDFGAVKDLSLGSSKGKRQLMLKRPKFPYGFQQFLKAAYRVRAAECMTLLTGWWWGDRVVPRNLHHQPSGSDWSVVSACSYHSPTEWRPWFPQNNSTICVRLFCVSHEEELRTCFIAILLFLSLLFPPLFLHSLPSIISNCLNLPFGIQEISRRLRVPQVALVVKNPPANAGDTSDIGSFPGVTRSPGERNDNPLQYSCLENPRERRAWWATVHRVAKSWIWLSD